MKLPPIVERELRVTARRAGFYWLRGLLGFIVGLKAYEFLVTSLPSSGTSVPTVVATGAALLHELTWPLFIGVLVMSLFSADSISRERREGTLGLLLLTNLTPRQIVHGKMLSCGLTTFAMLLGLLPALMITILAGGVNGAEALMTGLGLLADLFVVLAVGLWMSAVFSERFNAMMATVALVVGLAFGAEIVASAFAESWVSPPFRLLGLAGWMTTAGGPPGMIPVFVAWFGCTVAIGWLILNQATQALARNWQDKTHKQSREPEILEAQPAATLADEDTWGIDPARASLLTVPRPWDADPVRWRVEQMGSATGLAWFGVMLGFVAQFGLLGSDSSRSSGWGIFAVAGFLGMLVSGGLIAWIGARFFQHTRRQQDLELLLTTPVCGRDIVTSQWRVLRRTLSPPLGLVLLIAVPTGLAVIYAWTSHNEGEVWFFLLPFLISVNLAAETFALCWAGMHFGLHARTAAGAICKTVGLVQLIPLLATLVIIVFWSAFSTGSSPMKTNSVGMPSEIPALLLGVAMNIALVAWARLRLRRELRMSGWQAARLTPTFA